MSEEIADAVFRVKPKRKFDAKPNRTEYRCGGLYECRGVKDKPSSVFERRYVTGL